jgi:hypothetical protein
MNINIKLNFSWQNSSLQLPLFFLNNKKNLKNGKFSRFELLLSNRRKIRNGVNPASTKQTNRVAKKFGFSKNFFTGLTLR